MKINIIAFMCLCAFCSAEDTSLEFEDVNLCEFVECPVGTLCDEDRGVCIPFERRDAKCPPVRCMLACELGFKQDDVGCPICSCLQPNYEAEPAALTNKCVFKLCPRGQKCNPLTGQCSIRQCGNIRCALYCRNGFQYRNGCPMCACERDLA